MTVGEVIALRKAAGLTQTEMALRMGLSMRAYQTMESGAEAEPVLARHALAIEAASLRIAVERRNPMLTTAPTRSLALDLAAMIRGG